jgi:hypothetical protein
MWEKFKLVCFILQEEAFHQLQTFVQNSLVAQCAAVGEDNTQKQELNKLLAKYVIYSNKR